MSRFVKVFLLVCCFVFSKNSAAQDIRAAWIEYKWISGYTYSITLIILTDDNINSNNHCEATIYFGGGDSCVAYRSNGSSSASTAECPISYGGVIINSTPPIRKSIYNCVHTYGGPGSYFLYSNEKYRISGIKNMVSSTTKSIYVESLLSINQFMGPNSSVIIANYPISFTSVIGNQVLYNPGATDPDGDSLSYQLINCAITPTTSYYLPSNATVSQFGTLSFSKDSIGLYAFAYLIKEWRKDSGGNYVLVGSMLMDFSLDIAAGVGIKELNKTEILSIYPNPISNILNIKSNSKDNSEIEIINSLGQAVLKQNYSESIDVSKLESGYYILKITGEKNYYSKFIKN